MISTIVALASPQAASATSTQGYLGLPEGFYVIALGVGAVLGLILLPRQWRQASAIELKFRRMTRAVVPVRVGIAAAALMLLFKYLGDRGWMNENLSLALGMIFLLAALVCVGLAMSINRTGAPQSLVPPRFRDKPPGRPRPKRKPVPRR
jgi:hypothetical protein